MIILQALQGQREVSLALTSRTKSSVLGLGLDALLLPQVLGFGLGLEVQFSARTPITLKSKSHQFT